MVLVFPPNLLLPENFYCSWRHQSKDTFLIKSHRISTLWSQVYRIRHVVSFRTIILLPFFVPFSVQKCLSNCYRIHLQANKQANKSSKPSLISSESLDREMMLFYSNAVQLPSNSCSLTFTCNKWDVRESSSKHCRGLHGSPEILS